MLVSFLALIFPHTLEGIPWENYKVLEMELKTYTRVLHYIQHNFIRQRPGLSKDKITCPKALLLTISSSNIVTHSNDYIKGDNISFFNKSSCSKCSPGTKLFTK